MSARVCTLCGEKPVRSDNKTGICYLCQQKHGGKVRLCSCGCGRPVSHHNVSGLRADCRPPVAA